MQEIKATAIKNFGIIQTKDIIEFIPLLKELEFGDKFSLAMLKWCGIGKWDESLKIWEVYLAKLKTETIGIMGLYQYIDSPPGIVWVGWFGIRPNFRGQGWGTIMMEFLKEYALNFGFKELWVFTNDDNLPAISFYKKLKFRKLGTASTICPGKTHSLSDVVMKCELIPSCSSKA